jgi:thiol:disulfide interchange protein DsbD
LLIGALTVALFAVPLWAQFDGLGADQFGRFGATSQPIVTVTGQFTAPSPNRPAQLFVTAKIEPGWHIYSTTQPRGGPVATTIRLQPSPQYQLAGEFQVTPPPEKKKEPVFGNLLVESHYDRVTWYAPIQFAPGVDLPALQITGTVNAQPCDANSCRPPQNFPFTATLGEGIQIAAPPPGATERGPTSPGRAVATDEGAAAADGQFAAAKPSAPPTEATGDAPRFNPEQLKPEEAVEATSVGIALLFAFGGGLILNIMPCVLPVIGLKVLSFFAQAGESRARAFALNAWYSLGLLSVFLVLAALGVGLSEMFTARLFGIIMSCVVFAMALSLMGVWELRVPSFLGGGKAQALSEQEGAVGAFFKGIITTLLAIPCGAPLLSPALKWADEQVRAGAPANVYLAFAVIGLGMASPYLVIGAFPELLRFLPKPGAWMETFKKAMGYLLLVAVVWILYFLPIDDVVPTVGLLFGLWMACWLIGRLPITASTESKGRSWALAMLSAVGAGLICFLFLRPAMQHRVEKLAAASIQEGVLDEAVFQRYVAAQVENGAKGAPGVGLPNPAGLVANPGSNKSPTGRANSLDQPAELPWRPFNRAVFEQLVAENKTVLVDFTADWCLTCKTLEALVLNTQDTRQAVDRNGVVTLQADWTRGAPEVTEMLELLGSKQVPVVAIFPAGDPNRPIVFRGGYTKQALLDAIEKAGPSANAPAARTAMAPG